MFTLKLYASGKEIIHAATSFHIFRHRFDSAFQVTAYNTLDAEHVRFDVGPTGLSPAGGNFDYAHIVNGAGSVVESLFPKLVPVGA